ncbi:MAG: glycosyltransferase family 4 protein [Bacteroidales bacterium]|nr:glycosyltransferase family 4 protein [Bacteroidales bacterium]
MKIIYIHQYFHTPNDPGGTRSYWISKELVARGHQVIMITSTNKNHPDEEVVNIEGIEVHYLKNDYNNFMSKFEKVKSFVRFVRKSIKEAKKVDDADILFATSTPLTVGAVALSLKRRKKLKYVFEVRDLWPEFPIQIGAIRNPLVIKLLRAFEKNIYKNAEHIVALSPGMKDGVVSTGIPEGKVSMVPNMSKPEEFFPHEPDKSIASKFKINTSDFNIIHFGSMGVANGLDYIIETAKLCEAQGLSDVKFIFMGDGATLPLLKEKVEKYGLSNVKFLGNHKMSVVIEVVNLCDLSVTSFKNLPILATNSPNKLFDSLSAGKPIVVNSPGWTKDLVENENCGFYVNPDNPQDFVDKIKLYKDNKQKLAEWGTNSRKLSETKFNRSLLAKQVADIISGNSDN